MWLLGGPAYTNKGVRKYTPSVTLEVLVAAGNRIAGNLNPDGNDTKIGIRYTRVL